MSIRIMHSDSAAKRIDRLALLGRRIRGGADFWATIREAEAGEAICRRIGMASSYFNWCKRKGGVPVRRVAAMAAALDIPEAWVPVKRPRDALALVGQDVRAGVPFFDAVRQREAGGPLCRLLGLNDKASQTWRIRTGAIPPRYVQRVANLIACPAELLPVSRGYWHPPLTEEQKRVLVAAGRLAKMKRRERTAQLSGKHVQGNMK